MKYLVVGPDVSGSMFDRRHDVVEVDAVSPRDAKVKGVKEFRKQGAEYLNGNDRHPFARLSIVPLDDDLDGEGDEPEEEDNA